MRTRGRAAGAAEAAEGPPGGLPAPAEGPAAPALASPPAAGRLRLREPAAWVLLAVVLALQLHALGRIHGYQLADSVEYMERAWLVVQGERLDPGTVRSFAFSALLVPVFWVAELAGAEELHAAVGVCRALQIALGLGAVLVVGGVAARLFGRPAGLAAALVLGANPVFLRWSVEPLSGAAAALCIALAMRAMLVRGGFRRGLLVGTWLGLALLMAFQTVMILGAFGAFLAVRDGWRGRAHTAGVVAAVGACVVVQGFLDLAIYGAFASSLWNYFASNFAGTVASWLYELGNATGVDALNRAGIWLYERVFVVEDASWGEERRDLRSMRGRTWYLENLSAAVLAWPLFACFVVGLVRAAARPRWTTTVLALTVAGNVVVMAIKGSQSFRLWMPLLPMIAVLAGGGWGWIRGGAAAGPVRRGLAWAVLALGVALGVGIVRDTNLRPHGGYWDAMARVNALAEEAAARGEGPWRVASAYHWAVRFRDVAEVEHVKLPDPLYGWKRLDDERKAAVLAELEELDAFVSHLQLVEQDPALVAALNRRFEIDSAYWDPESFEDLLPIFVLRRRTGDPDAITFFEVDEDVDPGARQASLEVPRSVDFRRTHPDGSQTQMVLLGWDVEPALPGSGNVAWLTCHWYAGPLAGHDYTIVYRVSDPEGRSRQRNQAPAWGAHPTSTWPEGAVVSEGLPITLPSRWDDLGGAWCRGDLVPARLWIALPEYAVDEEGAVRIVGGLSPYRPSGASPVHRASVGGRIESEDGYVFSPDNLLLVGGVWLPVPEAARVPDDGRPLVAPDAP